MTAEDVGYTRRDEGITEEFGAGELPVVTCDYDVLLPSIVGGHCRGAQRSRIVEIWRCSLLGWLGMDRPWTIKNALGRAGAMTTRTKIESLT